MMTVLGKSVVRWMPAGLAAVLVIGGPARDAIAVCNVVLDDMFVSGPNFVVPGDETRDKARFQLTLGAGTITGATTPPGPQLTIHRLRFDLDCATGGLPCTDQGDVVSYGGDSTVTTDCPGVSWTTNVPGGGSATNEVVFTPTPAIVITNGTTNFCHLEFDLVVVNAEPNSGPQSNATPLVIEEVFGILQAAAFADGDATCNNNQQAGIQQPSAGIPECPPCVSDECTDRMCPDAGPDAGTCVETPKTSQPCTTTTQPPTTTTSTSTTEPSATSTTTSLPCTSARCTLEAAQTTAACAGQTIPARVTNRLSRAASLIDQAATSPAKQARKLFKKAEKTLRQAEVNAIRATKGKKPKLSSDCAAVLKAAADGVLAGLGV